MSGIDLSSLMDLGRRYSCSGNGCIHAAVGLYFCVRIWQHLEKVHDDSTLGVFISVRILRLQLLKVTTTTNILVDYVHQERARKDNECLSVHTTGDAWS